jgi:preprotein translocase subunit SecF
MIDFVRIRFLFYLLSAVLIVPGVISMILPGGLHPGIDFTSGTIITLQFQQDVASQSLRDAFADLGHPEATVQALGPNTYEVRTKPLQEIQGGTPDQDQTAERSVITNELEQRFGPSTILSLDQVSPLVAQEIVRDAVLAVAAASVFILLYLWWAFSRVKSAWRFGVCAVVALIHDALMVLGLFSLIGRVFPLELESTFIVAVLTVCGFSVHDTIVVFDRIRENSVRHPNFTFPAVVNHSLTQTLTRSLNTSLTVLLTLVALLLFGGSTIQTFVLALLIGITTGTYSSIFIASMLLVSWNLSELSPPRLFGRLGRRPALAPA